MRVSPWLPALAFAVAACGGDNGSTEPSTGSIEVTTTTVGTELDPDGFTVAVDGGTGQAIAADGSLTLDGLDPGSHSVALGGVADNCVVGGDNPRAVTVAGGETATAAFTVTCAPPPPPLAGRIAFETDRTGDFEVFAMLADGTDLVNLSQNAAAADYEPDWSPDGTRLAFVSDRDGNDEIYLMNADGTGQVRLTDDPGSDRGPDWSPDGSMIAFASDRDGNEEVYVMSADGSGQTNITNRDGVDEHPAWSRDGTRIAFQSDRSPAGDVEVYVMDADGGNPVNLSNDPESFDGRPAWSPDGTRIAFGSSRAQDDFEVWVMDADGGNPVRVTNAADFDSYPEWSPDGAYLAFRSDRTGNSEVFIAQANGAGPFNRTESPTVDCHPTWTATISGAGAAPGRGVRPAVGIGGGTAATIRAGAQESSTACPARVGVPPVASKPPATAPVAGSMQPRKGERP